MKRAIESAFVKWKNSSHRVPIILRGARQVGKSFVIESFGKQHFKSVAIVNFDYQPELAACFESMDPIDICSRLELLLNQRIIPGETLLFIDEIQNCPKAIMALRYFKERLPQLHVMAAGSLLEFVLHEEQFSFPVGRVQFMYLRPLSFREFLSAQNQEQLVQFLDSVSIAHSIDDVVHNRLIQLLRQYFLIGGMPAVVSTFIQEQSYQECQSVLTRLLETYRTDFSKYATKTQHKYLQKFFERAPALVGKNFKYSLIDSEFRSRDLKVALDQLVWAGLVQSVHATSASGLPLQAHARDNKIKVLFLDVGLMNCANKLDLATVWGSNLTHLNAGAQAEQFVGQELLAYADCTADASLYFWKREKQGSSAEVDYVVQVDSKIVPIEVKAGTTGQLRSLEQFMKEKDRSVGVRISQSPLSFERGVLSVPLYLIQQLPRLIKELHRA